MKNTSRGFTPLENRASFLLRFIRDEVYKKSHSYCRRSLTGFTLIETIVVISLTTVVLLALTNMILSFYRTNTFVLEQAQAIDSARRSVENAVQDLRESSYGANGAYPLAAAATSSVTFYANNNANASVEKVRYFLSGTTLYRGTTEPAGSPPSYVSQPEVTTLVVDNIRNATTSMFTYFDTNGSQLSSPIDLSSVRSIHISVFTDVNPLRAPNVYQLVGSATLRTIHNLNAY